MKCWISRFVFSECLCLKWCVLTDEHVPEMAYLNCIGLFKKMSDSEPDVISGLRMENLELKNRVVELSRQHPELVEVVK